MESLCIGRILSKSNREFLHDFCSAGLTFYSNIFLFVAVAVSARQSGTCEKAKGGREKGVEEMMKKKSNFRRWERYAEKTNVAL